MKNKTNIWILCSGRTGSSYLCEILNNSGLYPHIFERYNGGPGLRDFDNVHVNVKMIHYQWMCCHFKLKDVLLKFPDTKFIHLMRRDKLHQSISCIIANTCSTWRIYEDNIEYYRKIIENNIGKVKIENVIHKYIEYCLADDFWSDKIKKLNLDYIEVYYEDIFSSKDKILEILDFCDLDSSNFINNKLNIKLLKSSDVFKKYYDSIKNHKLLKNEKLITEYYQYCKKKDT